MDVEIRMLNLGSHVLHRFPAWESCNADAIPHAKRLILPMGQVHPPAGIWFRYCKRCFAGYPSVRIQ